MLGPVSIRKRESPLAHSFLLLGAGASADAGVPMSNQFVGRIEKHLAALPPPTNAAAVAELTEVRRFLENQLGREPGLEALYECIDDALDERFDTAPAGYPASRALERIHYETKRVIQTECVVGDVARVGFLAPLFLRLRRYGPYPIVSLNYDNVIELRSAHSGLRLAETVIGEPTAACDIELIKLHGSVTWMPRPGMGMQRVRDHSTDVVRRLGEIRSPILETPMIYPSRRKMPMYEPFMRNALRFQQLLADPNYRLCIVVGYSFPDAHVRSWLARALKARADLHVCLVGPNPEDEALDNLTKNLSSIPWTERLTVVKMTFAEAAGRHAQSFEAAVQSAVPFGPRLVYGRSGGGAARTSRSCYTGHTGGLGASRDGASLFVSEPRRSRVLKIDLRTNRQTTFTARVRDPRGIAVAADGTVLIVQNAALRLARFTPRGVGSVVAVAPNGRSRKVLNAPKLSEIFTAARRLRAGVRGDALWSNVRSLLRWPTDVAALPNGSIFATEARALVQLVRDAPPRRVAEPALVFNLHGLDAAGDDALVAVEEGVAQDGAWGRVETFRLSPHGVTCVPSAELEGQPRLMGICFIPPLQLVVVTQSLTWPHGRLIVVDYPSLSNARFIAGFDLPGKIAFVPVRDMLAVGTHHGVELVELSELAAAEPLRAP